MIGYKSVTVPRGKRSVSTVGNLMLNILGDKSTPEE
jgi:hypothetical protein